MAGGRPGDRTDDGTTHADEQTGEAKVLDLTKNSENSDDWTDTLIPHLTLVSSSAADPRHPRTVHRFTVGPQHCNRLGTMHGGCTATLFDHCTSTPLMLVGKPGFWLHLGVSRTLSVSYLRPVACGETVLFESEVIALGARLCTIRGTLRREADGRILATCEHGKFNTDAPVGRL